MALISAGELATAIGSDVGTATRLLAVTQALVDRYLAGAEAPKEIKTEAIIRSAGWLHESKPSDVRRKQIGEVAIERVPSMAAGNPLRMSGAMAILTHYKRRRAGAIKAATE